MREKATVLERDERLSQSMLWRLMRAFYDEQGLEAWRTADPVPHYVTTSPSLVHAYTRIIRGYLQDCMTSGQIDTSEPVYIVELGAGHGRLGYRLVKRLRRALPAGAPGSVPWVYVLSDLSQRNVESWEAQPLFRPLIEEGLLDFARFDIGQDDAFRLVHAGTVLAEGEFRNPLIVVANYIFDSLPHDAFYDRDGLLYERRVTLSSAQPEPDLADPSIVERVDVSCTHQPVAADYYEDQAWNQILTEYRDRLPEAALLFPVGALECIRALERIAGGRILLLAGDKGWTRDELFPGGPEPLALSVHAGRCFSMMVNFHAIARYAAQRGATALLPRRAATSLVVAALLFGEHAANHAHTQQSFSEAVDAFGPDDFYTLMRGVSDLWPSIGAAQICACLQLADGDDLLLGSCMSVLLDAAASLPDEQRQQLRTIVRETWDSYLPIGDHVDRAFQYGTLLYELGYYAEALELFQSSAATHGRTASTMYNIGACEFALRRLDQAWTAVLEALERDPMLESARALRLTIEAVR